MRFIHVDFETYSKRSLNSNSKDYVGTYAYAADPSTDIWCMCYSDNDSGRVDVWRPGDAIPSYFAKPFILCAHNYQFEKCIWSILMDRYGFTAAPAGFVCTMAAAMRNNLPAGLDDLAAALGLDQRKDKAGHKLMIKMSNRNRYNPNKEGSTAQKNFAEDIHNLIEYCRQDVLVEIEASKELAKRAMVDNLEFLIDEEINDRGVKVDVGAASSIMKVIRKELKSEEKRLGELTGGAVTSGRQTAKMLTWLREEGYNDVDLQAETVAHALDNPGTLTAKGIEVLRIRKMLALGSLAKLDVMANNAAEDSRLRGLFQLYGASQTGRWGGRMVQPQNLPRGGLSDAEVAMLIMLFCVGDGETVKMLYGDMFKAAKMLIRAMFISRDHQKFIVADFAQIECRVLGWLAGCDKLVGMFADADIDPYAEMAAKIFNKPSSECGKGTDERFLGKTVILGCGYQMGATKLGITIGDGAPDDQTLTHMINTFRTEFPEIPMLWTNIEQCFSDCLDGKSVIDQLPPGATVTRAHVPGLKFDKVVKDKKAEIIVTLPSGRTLHFHDVRYEDNEDRGRKQLSYIKAKDGLRTTTYGGKLTENVVQAIARDLMMHALIELSKAELPVVMHIHDEVVVEVNSDDDLAIDDVRRIMSSVPAWADGLPLACEAHECTRYTK